MNVNISSRGALFLVFVGIVLAVAGSVVAHVTGGAAWRYLIVIGGLLQSIGWVLYLRRIRGGAV
ncbi:hypothetical protein [Streptomyces sp. NBC_01500]|uniref:hypothetical protein n=1 Tax=Streptomyces sp. NBC_01500 TaxID=2903886 RepID=UPI002256FF4C|nr:hypothetical protein [Streptomyces sp. NBC_01500]MCX4549256.1 hypothetical protein [Streptomyces sp. NBC_01500]